jgi:hypothetical protein
VSAPAGLPYLETTAPDYAGAAASKFTIEDHGAGLQILRGPCPRCAAPIDIPIVRQVVKSFGAAPDTDNVEPVMCTCEETHDGRPEGRVGCGAYWNFAL